MKIIFSIRDKEGIKFSQIKSVIECEIIYEKAEKQNIKMRETK